MCGIEEIGTPLERDGNRQYFRPVGALVHYEAGNQGLTPLAINDRPLGAHDECTRNRNECRLPAPTGPKSIARGVSPWIKTNPILKPQRGESNSPSPGDSLPKPPRSPASLLEYSPLPKHVCQPITFAHQYPNQGGQIFPLTSPPHLLP
jgi:hypothetical protein